MHEDRRKANPPANSDVSPLVRVPLANLGKIIALLILVAFGLVYVTERSRAQQLVAMPQKTDGFDQQIAASSLPVLEDGKQIFRFDTFGDEVFWGNTLKLLRAIAGAKLGGVLWIEVGRGVGDDGDAAHGQALPPALPGAGAGDANGRRCPGRARYAYP